MDAEERRLRVNEIEDDLDDIRDDINEIGGMLLSVLEHMQVGENYPPETCKELYAENKTLLKKILRRVDDVSGFKIQKLR